jgi:hypothetical protein
MDKRGQNPIDEQPYDEKVQSLEGMKAQTAVVLKSRTGEHDNGSDPAYNGDVASHSGGAGGDFLWEAARLG